MEVQVLSTAPEHFKGVMSRLLARLGCKYEDQTTRRVSWRSPSLRRLICSCLRFFFIESLLIAI